MTLIQGILIGMIYWLNACAFGGSTFELLWRYPINNVLWVGLILGDVPTAMIIGATIQPAYLGMLYLGSVMPADMCSAGIVPAACVLAYGMDTNTAIALAVPVSVLFAQLQTIFKTLCSLCYRMADKAIEKRNYNMLGVIHLGVSALMKVAIFWAPMTILLLLGGDAISQAANALPEFFQKGFSVCSKMMPAIGFAMIIKMIGKPALMPYFLAGYFFYGYTKLGSIAIGLVGFFLAWLSYTNKKKEEDGNILSSFKVEGETEAYKGVVTKRDISKVWWRWLFGSHATDGYERLKGLDFTWAMLPFLKKVYKDDPDELQLTLARHNVYYNTTPDLGNAVIMGCVVSLEEQRAKDHSVPEEVITNIKNGLMGPFAGIGDTMSYAVIRPIVFSFFISAGLSGNWWAGVAPTIICWFIFNVAYGYFLYHYCYKLGTNAAVNLLHGNIFNKLIDFFSVLGMFAIGGIAAQNVSVICGITMTFEDGTLFDLQSKLFDALAPGMVGLIVTLLTWYYLYKGGKITYGIFGLIFIGLILGGFGVLA